MGKNNTVRRSVEDAGPAILNANTYFASNVKSLIDNSFHTPKPLETVAPPATEDVKNQVLSEQKNDLQKKRASSTLFTGGQGVLDTAPTASTTLLGI